jgi:hypothetical protein
MRPIKFLIYAPPFQTDDGGAIVLHRLCALLNDLGYEAYLARLFVGSPIYPQNFLRPLVSLVKYFLLSHFTKLQTNPEWSTPVLSSPSHPLGRDWIVVYPEIVFGNPLQAECVVRWFLHRPGFHMGQFFFGCGEYHVDFNAFAKDFSYPGSRMAKAALNVLAFPFEYYNLDGALPPKLRNGTAYCIRKGKGKPFLHDVSNSVLIDGKSHAEVAAIFKRVNRFISYDPHTAYSWFAVLCGAESVVVPDSGVPKHGWYPDPADRYGVAYGFDDLDWAKQTAPEVLARLKAKEAQSIESVKRFAEDALQFFDK